MVKATVPKPASGPGSYNSIAAQYARAKAIKDAEDAAKASAEKFAKAPKEKSTLERLSERKRDRFKREWIWVAGAFVWFLFIHASGLYFFTKGFLLTRLVLDEKSSCAVPPIALNTHFKGEGTIEGGCWHPKTFDRAMVVIIDALRYDFTIPFKNESQAQAFHNAIPVLYETVIKEPHNAFLLPFIADPPTTTLQRLKGLTTGNLPTFIDAGSNFAGEAIREDNLLMQLKDVGKKMVHLGDDTWTALFPGYFEPNISRAYHSLKTWDLHSVDNGVLEHIFPLVREKEKKAQWDVMFAHFLGVDHAGHTYGPNHPGMTAKLQQMDQVVRELIEAIDDDTLLVIMGDHGMDKKGDHGGESEDEVEAALWMYSRKGVFGRTDPSFVTPPPTAKVRPVNQLDLVPTLALLLGIPIPFNNLGQPIEEAFAGKKGNSWENLASVGRMASAAIKRYQAAYYEARGIDESVVDGSPRALWATAEAAFSGTGKKKMWKEGYSGFSTFQAETLRISRDLWSRFDVPSITLGVAILAAGVIALILFANDNAEDGAAVEDPELDRAEQQLELENFSKGITTDDDETSSRSLVLGGLIGSGLGALAGTFIWGMMGQDLSLMEFGLAGASIAGPVGVFYEQIRRRIQFSNPLPTTLWGWDGSYLHSQSTYYASETSSTSAPWQLIIPFAIAIALPSIIKSYYATSRSYEGFAPIWITWAFRGGLVLSAIFWVLDAADGGKWASQYPAGLLRRIRVPIAQTILAVALGAGTTAFTYAPPCVSISTVIQSPPPGAPQTVPPKPTVTILGFANTHGSRYLLLVTSILLSLILVQKPMGGGSLALMAWQTLSLLEILDLLTLTSSPIGPIVLALLGSFHFFKTGHQATLTSIDWNIAFLALHEVRYPWSAILVALNSFGTQILAVAAVPLVVLWKQAPKKKGLLRSVVTALAYHVLYYAVIGLATTMWAGHLRRHLMLYRIFCPKFLTAAAVMVVVDVVGIVVALAGFRVNRLSVGEVFGW
ncbi:hypothetical protein G7Y89_g6462 [Cudoniella acicularis]|uniref:GPI ethanolamine phosphate transferase 3 n=1 Tax=Cudoniella acicularis TaxID=354080 RepID=A0A8H4RMQ3_9HELO|nr:hypothetical protein G7Y89_g6462 [Cudoniella acicularis]